MVANYYNNSHIFHGIKFGIIIFMLGLMIPSSFAADVYFVPSSKIVDPGQTFDLDIYVNPAGTPIAGAQLNIAYNISILKVNSVIEGNLFKQNGASTFFNNGNITSPGTIVNIFDTILGPRNVSTSGKFIRINATAIGTSGSSGIYLSNVKISDAAGNLVLLNVANVSISINTIPASTPTPTPAPTPVPTPTSNTFYDNRLREGSPDTVLGGSSFMDIGQIPGSSRYRDVLRFDLSSYNKTDMINNAILSLFWYYPASARNRSTTVEIYRPLAWDTTYVNWKNRTFNTPWNNPGGDWFDKNNVAQGSVPYASVTFNANSLPDNKYYSFNVTELVQKYVAGNYNNTGFFLKAKDENDNYIAFYSLDWSNVSQRPKLAISYTTGSNTPIPTPTSSPTPTPTPTVTPTPTPTPTPSPTPTPWWRWRWK